MQLQTHYEARQLVNPLWHLTHLSGRLSTELVYETLSTSAQGLSEAETALRIKHYGFNELPEPARRSLFLRFTEQLTHFMALLLWVAGTLAFISGTPELGWAIWVAIFSFFICARPAHGICLENRG